jgi:hypothetical protein
MRMLKATLFPLYYDHDLMCCAVLGWFGFVLLIIAGSGGGCLTGLKRVSGFPALEGWDPVTGLGTPDYAEMSKLLA